MKKVNKIRASFQKSNNYRYTQVFVDNKLIITTDSRLKRIPLANLETSQVKCSLKKNLEIYSLYNKRQISLNTLSFLRKKLERKTNQKIIKLAVEFSWESGLLQKKETLQFY